jgi:hypothetical protein
MVSKHNVRKDTIQGISEVMTDPALLQRRGNGGKLHSVQIHMTLVP